ncbi:AAA family ATPase [Lentzea sp. BCCO 10_0061]|uniref:Nuclease SbcCD subunit C n=1 Tax=Lentzea sokolovensis TaxID=3095429 RepID=A0ABU4UWS1_9PSEU|nr:AAA family ATPase [Lentzea sp. BCCO 10_0061]MDX8143947.1 AAA family ATPase [Lentzea sp. BCCO 10_0061]
MIRFPIFERLSVDRYGLYPGTDQRPGLTAEFEPGLTLVLGANGLGKSTLVLLLYRLCSGTTDIAGVASRPELGSRQLDTSGIPRADRKTFAARVHDGAAGATATLQFRLGETELLVERDLSNLTLLTLMVDGQPLSPTEDEYKRAITEAAGVHGFEDWILILRYLVFYFEDRRSLVWDTTAQRQILRLLFLSPAETETYLKLEAELLSKDSTVRNLSATLFKQESALKNLEKTSASRSALEQAINDLAAQQDAEEGQLERLESELNLLDSELQSAKLAALRAAEERESAYRNVEYKRLEQIHRSFPSTAESSAYILSQLLSADTCIACSTEVPSFAEELRSRLDHSKCVVCSTPIEPLSIATDEFDMTRAVNMLKNADEHRDLTRAATEEAQEQYKRSVRTAQELRASLARRETQIDALVSQLPQSEHKIRERRSELNSLRSQQRELTAELQVIRASYTDLIDAANHKFSTRQEEVKAAFDSHAVEFLLETCELAWGIRKEKVGQQGSPVEFAVFEVDMTGSDFNSPVRRRGAEQVSESQREFIDLAFRMALIAVAGEGGTGTLVMDAPESSLDAVFAPRAAKVLAQFCAPPQQNRVILTSNLVEGKLIPTLLRSSGIVSREDSRLINLFEIASPTAALTHLRAEYDEALMDLFDGGDL